MAAKNFVFKFSRKFREIINFAFREKFRHHSPWMFYTKKKGLIFWSLKGILADIYKNVFIYILKLQYWDRILSVSFIIFRNKTCRFSKTPSFRILRTSPQDIYTIQYIRKRWTCWVVRPLTAAIAAWQVRIQTSWTFGVNFINKKSSGGHHFFKIKLRLSL